MDLDWFRASVYNIDRIEKKDGQIMAYLFITKPEITNDQGAILEAEQKLQIIVPSNRMSAISNLSVGDEIKILVYLNSKSVTNKLGKEHILKSLQLRKLQIIKS